MRPYRIIAGFAGGLVVIALSLLMGCQGTHEQKPSPPSPMPFSGGQILYLVDNTQVTTYTIDPNTLDVSVAGPRVGLIAASSFVLQLVPSPDDHFLYVVWSDSQQHEYLSVYATDKSGTPQIPAVQVLSVSSLSQLNIHPSGAFAYAMTTTQDSAGLYTSTILLFHATASGMLQVDPHPQGVYGPALMPTLLYGVRADGTELYLRSEDENRSAYWQRAVNPQEGTLGTDILLFAPPVRDSVALGAAVIVDYQNALTCSEPRYVNVFSNQPEATQLIHCGGDMLDACGTATNVQVDPSGEYLFLTDPASQKVRVAGLKFSNSAIMDTGNFLPFTMQTPGFAFSPDGTLVYALLARDCSLHIYRFDPGSGYLMESDTSIPMSDSAVSCPQCAAKCDIGQHSRFSPRTCPAISVSFSYLQALRPCHSLTT